MASPDSQRRHAVPHEVSSSYPLYNDMTNARSHVYSTFHPNEIQLDSIIQESDWTNPEMMLTKDNFEKLDRWQIDTALATWRAMSNSMSTIINQRELMIVLTPEMWLAW